MTIFCSISKVILEHDWHNYWNKATNEFSLIK